MHRAKLRLCAGLMLLSACFAGQAEDASAPKPESPFVKFPDGALENVVKVDDTLYSGGVPDGEKAFAELQKLGIKTVITVDGAKPDVELAKKYGLRYVHLPIGYDGVPREQAQALAKAFTVLEGPIYVHCHHGKHRSPAATAVGAVMCGRIKPEWGEAILKLAGTDPGYTGLYKSAQVAKPLEAETLQQVPENFPETTPVPPMADVMVEMDLQFEHLIHLKEVGWKPSADHPDLDPPHVALQLREHYHETNRIGDDERVKKDDFKEWLEEGEKLSQKMESLLRARKEAAYAGDPHADLNATFKALKANCTDCHKAYRNPGRRVLEP